MNINDTVFVRLTAKGHGCRDDDYWSAAENAGYWQLWRLMQVFGPHIHLGMIGTLFENNEVQIIGDLSAGRSLEFSPAYRAICWIDEDRERLIDDARD